MMDTIRGLLLLGSIILGVVSSCYGGWLWRTVPEYPRHDLFSDCSLIVCWIGLIGFLVLKWVCRP